MDDLSSLLMHLTTVFGFDDTDAMTAAVAIVTSFLACEEDDSCPPAAPAGAHVRASLAGMNVLVVVAGQRVYVVNVQRTRVDVRDLAFGFLL